MGATGRNWRSCNRVSYRPKGRWDRWADRRRQGEGRYVETAYRWTFLVGGRKRITTAWTASTLTITQTRPRAAFWDLISAPMPSKSFPFSPAISQLSMGAALEASSTPSLDRATTPFTAMFMNFSGTA